ncbi:MAG: SpoIIE family protein phosphatase [Defluviitaleaceae bacterium]|nr:SpoIIE family protein phosphatase [Defluviitaleaceae bacterium]MCL2835349.1 SpoIIE family protein phosphatase [Defluviitaleaceae bacterium]
MNQKGALFKTIRMKLLMPILCAVILGGLIMGITAYRMTSDVMVNEGIKDGLRSAQTLREMVDMTIATAHFDLSTLSSAPTLRRLLLGEGEPDDLEAQMMELIARQPLYNSMIALNSTGTIMASTSGSAGQERGDREYFIESMKGNNFISPVEVSRQTGRMASFISIPVYDEQGGEVIGVMMAALQIMAINDRFVSSVTILDGFGYAMIATGEGTVIAHRDEEAIGGPMLQETMVLLAQMTDESAVFKSTRDGTGVMVFAGRSQYTDWYSIVVCPVSDFYRRANTLAQMIAILVTSITIFIAAIVWVAVSGVTKALSAAIRYADVVARGELNTSLDIQRNDEVGVLAGSLREMVGKLKDMIEIAELKTAEAEAATETIMSGIAYASKIQRNLLPKNKAFDNAFTDYSIIWEPRDVVGGDIYWAKNFDGGTALCVCDCTGHGTPGALLTMLVVSALEASVNANNYTDTAQILYILDQKLASVLNVEDEADVKRGITDINDGCDLALLFIANDGSVSVASAHTHVFVCDGSEVFQYKGQNISVGEGKLKSKNEVIIQNIRSKPSNKFYIASDGLFDQIGGVRSKSFGYKVFKQIILDNHHEPQASISGKVWDAFMEYQGAQARRDDVELLSFVPKIIKK